MGPALLPTAYSEVAPPIEAPTSAGGEGRVSMTALRSSASVARL